MSAFDSYCICLAAQLLSSVLLISPIKVLRQVRACIVCKCGVARLLLVRAPDMRWLLATATATATGNWQLVNDYQFVINGQADRCWPRPKMCICDRHNKSVESVRVRARKRARERGSKAGSAGGKLAKNGSKCWHCRRPLVDANRV